MTLPLARESAMVRKETIANTVATAVIAAVLCLLIFRGESLIAAISPPVGGIFGIVPGTFNFTLLVTLALTLITRRRVRAGLYSRIGAGGHARLGTRLPDNVLLRALSLAACTTVSLVPITVALVWTAIRVGVLSNVWSFSGMLVFFVIYFALLSLVITPVILWRALRD